MKQKSSNAPMFIILLILIVGAAYILMNKGSYKDDGMAIHGITGTVIAVEEGSFVVETPIIPYGDISPSPGDTWEWNVSTAGTVTVYKAEEHGEDPVDPSLVIDEIYIKTPGALEDLSEGDRVVLTSTQNLKKVFTDAQKSITVSEIVIYDAQ